MQFHSSLAAVVNAATHRCGAKQTNSRRPDLKFRGSPQQQASMLSLGAISATQEVKWALQES